MALTSKDVRMGVRKGFTVKDFCKKYGINGKEAFIVQLEKAYPHGGSDQILKEIRKNEKIKSKAHNNTSTTSSTKKGGEQQVEEEKTDEERLEDLKVTENKLSNEVMELEKEYQSFIALRKKQKDRMRELEDKTDKLYAEIQATEAEYDKVVEENNVTVDKTNAVIQSRSEKLASLDETREKIKALTVVSIGVNGDCSLEVLDGEISIELPGKDDEINNLAHQMMDKEICENLTMKQIKTLAKLIVLDIYSGQKIRFIFDNEVLEKAYSASYQDPLSP